MKYNVISSDPPWPFSDKLTMSDVKRGAEANYSTLSIDNLRSLDVKSIAADDSVLALWCPSSLLQEGLLVVKDWGFKFTQTHIWVKTKKFPLENLLKKIDGDDSKVLESQFTNYNLSDSLAFGMGRLFRQSHEIVLLGVKGKIYNYLANKSQRSVHFHKATKHSEKPEDFQDMLEKMFPNCNYLEMFARRERENWMCIGNESPTTYGEDIRDSLNRLKNENAVTGQGV
jgi:N6-adenosine-specific RNA methylase IME4